MDEVCQGPPTYGLPDRLRLLARHTARLALANLSSEVARFTTSARASSSNTKKFAKSAPLTCCDMLSAIS